MSDCKDKYFFKNKKFFPEKLKNLTEEKEIAYLCDMERSQTPTKELSTIRQSYAATFMRQDRTLSLISMKVKYRMLQVIQPLFANMKVGDDGEIPNIAEKDRTVLIDLSKITTPNHYSYVEEAVKTLYSANFRYSDEKYKWRDVRLLESKGETRSKDGRYYEVVVSQAFLKVLAQRGGWVAFYDAELVCRLSSSYSMRLYEMVARRKEGAALVIPYDLFRSYLGLEGKKSYAGLQGMAQFDRRVIRTAKAELDEKSPYSFTYKRVKDEDGEWKCFVVPTYIRENDTEANVEHELAKQVSIGLDMPKVKKLLTSKEFYGFSREEVKANNDVWMNFEKQSGQRLLDTLLTKYPVAATKDNPKGWIIATLRRMMEG